MSNARPSSGTIRVGTASRGRMAGSTGRPPTGTNMNSSARPVTRGGALGGALNAAIHVSDRPVTRQGLGGIKTAAQGPQRQVQDKSYWLSLLRGKMNDLNVEISALTKEINLFNQENASYLSYEKRAEVLALEIKELQGELADYNSIVDKLNMNAGFEDLTEDFEKLRLENQKEAKKIDDMFAKKQDKEKIIKQLEIEINQQRSMTESLVSDMPSNLREKYVILKKQNLHLQEDLEIKQQTLDNLNSQIDNLEEDISQSNVKQEAVTLYEKIFELEEKKNMLLEEEKSTETPAQERERLLKQVKDDNQEIARMESRAREIREKTEKLQDEISQLDVELEEHHGERTAKYKELKKRDEDMQEFLDKFDENKNAAEQNYKNIEENVVQLLEKISRATIQSKHIPSATDLKVMKDDLSFKAKEMNKSKDTAIGLDGEHAKLRQDLEKVQLLEEKITKELDTLKQKIKDMQKELAVYSDINTLKKNVENKKNMLLKEKDDLLKTKEKLSGDVANLTKVHDSKQKKLEQNETYIQLGNLERKWQHLEQNNLSIKDYIAQKTAESNYTPIKQNVSSLTHYINQLTIKNLSSGKT
ncbi:intraflagellar transport protein 74 homolog isoform X1 [Hydra vulgaris]|uniref:Intraflagellar transport protein 74 homolog n=1 Tax=Hydra vulgaris TaxID=6087 RepID=T2M7F0_HYDVU|nr:intraflagellar transport protein 74 homolog [Hydra vulgaris]